MDPDRDLDACYDHIMKLVDEVGEIIASRYFTPKTIETKCSNIDLVTETDQQVEKYLVKEIVKKFPSHKFIGEEDCADGNKKAELTNTPTWIIDPVDGTMNFVHNFPHSCVSVALLVDKVTEIGIIYNPVLKQKFTARRGKGAFYNGKQIKVSGEKKLSQALLITEFGTSRDEEKVKVTIENMDKLVRVVHGIRSLGSAALNMAMVALGAADLYFEFGPHAWDMAAGDLLIREAGGVSLDTLGGPLDIMSRRMVGASSKELVDEFIPYITQFHPLPRDD